MENPGQIHLLLLFSAFLVLGVEICSGYPTIIASSPFQTINEELILQCKFYSNYFPDDNPVTFSFNGNVVYNSTNQFANGVKAIAPSDRVEPINSIRVLNKTSHLTNVTCSYDGVTSSNILDIPYLAILKYWHSSDKFELDQTVTAFCEIAMEPMLPFFVVRFLYNAGVYYEYLFLDNEMKTQNAEYYSGIEITGAENISNLIFTVNITRLLDVDSFQDGMMHCELESNLDFEIGSNDIVLSKSTVAPKKSNIEKEKKKKKKEEKKKIKKKINDNSLIQVKINTLNPNNNQSTSEVPPANAKAVHSSTLPLSSSSITSLTLVSIGIFVYLI